MKKLVALLLTVAMVLGMTAAFADEPIKLTFWTFQELHTELYKTMEDKWNADGDKPAIEVDYQVFP